MHINNILEIENFEKASEEGGFANVGTMSVGVSAPEPPSISVKFCGGVLKIGVIIPPPPPAVLQIVIKCHVV